MCNFLKKHLIHFYKDISEALSLLGKDWQESFYISSKQNVESLPDEIFKTDYFTIVICLEGEVIFETNKQEEKLITGTIFTATPSTFIQFKNFSRDLKVSTLFFTKSFLLNHFANPNLIFELAYFKNLGYRIFKTTQQERQSILTFFDFLQERNTKETPHKIEIIKSVIFTILFQIAEVYIRQKKEVNTPSKRVNDIYYKFKRLIEVYLPEEKQVSFYARKLQIDTKYLTTLLKKHHNKTPKQLIDIKLAEKATLLLANSSLNINQISYKLHFSSTASFTRFYKRVKGITPSTYQKGIRK